MKRMYLKHNNQYITIDDEDYEKIKQYDWYINKN